MRFSSLSPVGARLLARLYCTALTVLTMQFGSAYAQSIDTTFYPAVPYYVGTFSFQENGKIVVGQYDETFAAFTKMNRYNADGSIDSGFDHYGNAILSSNQGNVAWVQSISSYMDGSVTVSGTFDLLDNYQTVPKIAKFDAAGQFVRFSAPDTTAPGWVVGPFITALPDGRSLVFGSFSQVGIEYGRRGAILLDPSGQLVRTFYPRPTSLTTGATQEYAHRVWCAVSQSDGKVILAGEFDEVDGKPYPFLARVNSTGALDLGFQPQPNGYCSVIALQPDGKILVAGNFFSIGGGSANGIARLNVDGSIDPDFSTSVSGVIRTMLVRADGRILIGGSFSLVNSVSRFDVALLEADGSLSPYFNGSVASNNWVSCTAIQENGAVTIGGPFSQIGGYTRSGLARFLPERPAVSVLETDADGTELLWTRGGSVQEIENVEFRMSLNGTSFTTLLGQGERIPGGWRLPNLKLPGNKVFYVQAKGLTRGGYLNASTSVTKISQNFFRTLPQITSGPVGQTVIAGDTGITFSVGATSDGTAVYQWKRNGKAIPGATGDSYTIPGPVGTVHAGTYTCSISNSAGSVTTTPAVLIVIVPIAITAQPLPQSVKSGKPVTFAVKVSGTSPTYQWLLDGSPLPGATSSTYKIPSAAVGHEGVYTVAVTNGAGTVTSTPAELYVVDVPATVTPPSDQIFAVGQTVGTELEATIASDSPPLIKWLKNGRPVPNEVASTLDLAPVALTMAGRYTVSAANPAGTVVSTPFDVTIVDQSPNELVLLAGKLARMTATATGSGTLQYRWRKGAGPLLSDGGNVSGALTKTLTITGVSPGDAGTYICEVTSVAGMLESGPWDLAVSSGVPIIVTPVSLPTGMLNIDYDFTVPIDPDATLKPTSFLAKGLPPGLKISGSGRITGRPSKAGTFSVSLTPVSPFGKGAAVLNLPLVVQSIPAEFVGNYVARVPGDMGSSLFSQGARVDLTVTVRGDYSGKVTLGSVVLPFKGGKLNVNVGVNDPNAITIPRKGNSPLTLTFSLNETNQQLTGTLSDGVESGAVAGWRNIWSVSAKAETYRGYYTTRLEGGAIVPGVYSRPDGDGYLTVSVNDTGLVKQVGMLPDGTPLLGSSFVGPDGQLLVYNPLYKPTGGLLDGKLDIVPAGVAPAYLESNIQGTTDWSKAPLVAGVSFAPGFAPLTLTAAGAKYTKSTGGNILGSNPLSPSGDVNVVFEGARIEESVGQEPSVVGLMTATSVFKLPVIGSSNPAGTVLKLNTATGVFTGSFSLTGKKITIPGYVPKRTAKVFGVVLRNPALPQGSGHGAFRIVQFPGSSTSQVLSGRVTVDVVP